MSQNSEKPASLRVGRLRSITVSRWIILVTVLGSLAGYFWQPTRLIYYVAEVLARTYLHFVAGGMGHEAAHGHLGNSKRANLWWGRIALLPTTVPYVTFRKTHLHHHAATNIHGKDPDEFLNTRRVWQIPFRAIMMPHHWALWLWKQNRFRPAERLEYAGTYLGYALVYGTIGYLVGIERLLFSLLPAAILHSLLLWYLFAIKTHEGYSTGALESRSHDYHGRSICWLSFGLSMHRLHHLKPGLSWLEIARQTPRATTWRQTLLLQRDIRPESGLKGEAARAA